MPLLDLLLFPQKNACHLCGRFQDTESVVCSSCLNELEMLRLPATMSRRLPVLSGSAAAFRHTGLARNLVHQLKYRSDPAVTALMGLYMASALGAYRADAVVPVPLHPQREAARGYNQAALLAEAVAHHTGMKCDSSVLLRVRPTDSQTRLGRQERLSSMARAFRASEPGRIQGRKFLLVDDVVTTGATAIACASELMQEGAKEVVLLTFCRA